MLLDCNGMHRQATVLYDDRYNIYINLHLLH